MAEYAKIADGVEGYAYVDPETNELVTLQDDSLGTTQTHLRPATREEIEGARAGHAASSMSQKALGLGEQALSGATFGQVQSLPFTDIQDFAGRRARSQVLGQENPILKGAANVAGTLLPSIAAEAVTGGAATPLVGAAWGGRAAFAAGTLAQAAAQEFSQAAQTDRDVEIGNIAQGLMEGAAFLGVGRLAGKLFRRAEQGVADVAQGLHGGPADTLARGQAKAATAAEVERITPTRAEARYYAQNAEQINSELNDLGYQAGNNLFGREGSFQKAHAIQYKKADIFGKMQDADVDLISDAVNKYADEADALSAKLVDTSHTSAPSPAASRSLRAQAGNLRATLAAGDVEDAAIAVDSYKRHLDDLREKFGSPATKGSDPLRANVKMIDEVLEPTRAELIDPKIWGKNWAQKQAEENALWSGKDGIINSRALWQSELMQRAPGAAGSYRTEWGTLPVFQMKGDIVERVLGMNPSQRRQVIGALENDIAKTEAMSQIKLQIGGPGTRDAVGQVLKDTGDLKEALGEIKRLTKLQDVHGAILKKGAGAGIHDELGEAIGGAGGAAIGGAVGGPVGAVVGGIAGRGLKKVAADLLTPVGRESRAMAIADLKANIAARNADRVSGKFKGAGAGDIAERLKATGRKVVQAGKETTGEAIAGTAMAGGALGIAHVAAETAAIRELDQHGRETTERAMLALANPNASIMRLPPAVSRFQGDYPDLQTAYLAKFGDLKKLATDPEAFIERVSQAFQPLAEAGHPEVASKLIQRMQIGVQYLLENAPPTMGQSMFNPDGDQPDDIAILQYAPVWEAVWHPLDTVRDVASMSAGPSAIKALKAVHPDVHSRLLAETFRTLAQAGPTVDFETKRYLDNVFDMGAALGRSFSPQFSNLMAQQRAGNKQPSAQSLGGESVIAPPSATAGFSNGPTAIR
jgi:hypothetical protein